MTNQSLTMSTSRPPRQRLKDIRPQQLLDAALGLFVEKGFAATRSEEVASLAGVSKGTLYLYYPSKEELFKAVVRQNLTKLIGEGAEFVAAFEGSSAELLLALYKEWWLRVADTGVGGLHKVVLAEVRNFPELAQFYADEVIAPAHRIFIALIERGIASGEFRKVDPASTAHALIIPMVFLMLHQYSIGACQVHGGKVDPLPTLQAHADLILHGLLRRPGKAR